jgi:phosphoglucomutase/phosphomannomutase
MTDVQALLDATAAGFQSLNVSDKYRQSALQWIERWLIEPAFKDYVPQIEALIGRSEWSFLLDAFYQVIPFGTGGRRGPVGIGPNRINAWTIQSSAQGHAQYLIKQYGAESKNRGVVLTYDVRKFTAGDIYDATLPNPVMNLSARRLAEAAAQVYAANGIKVFLFDDVRTTPELSFAIRYLNAVAGDMFSASHNLPTDNGKKVYDAFGGQLIPPHDQALVDEVTTHVTDIKVIDFQRAVNQGLVEMVGEKIDRAYIQAVLPLSLSTARNLKILYSPLHGTGQTTVYPVLSELGFDVHLDPSTANPSGEFENVTFNIPNPEVVQSFDSTFEAADAMGADIILNSDPDADRIGIMVRHDGRWRFITGNEIGILLTRYGIEKYASAARLNPNSTVIKTDVTTSLIAKIAAENGVRCVGDLLVGFKYIGAEMNRLEQEGTIDDFILGTEESHGYIMGNYCRDKDAAGAAVWLAERAAELQRQGRTLIDDMADIYSRYGCCENYLTEIRLLGASGMEQIHQIMTHLRETDVAEFGGFKVARKIDRWQGPPQPHLSHTDTSSRNVIIFHLNPAEGTDSMRLTVRPSGTEPKIKMYFEVVGCPCAPERLEGEKEKILSIRRTLEKTFMQYCYRLIGVDFPERGFLLFWQLPLSDKLMYFEIEERIAGLKTEPDAGRRREALQRLLAFLGSNPIQKVDEAFKARYGKGISEYLNL